MVEAHLTSWETHSFQFKESGNQVAQWGATVNDGVKCGFQVLAKELDHEELCYGCSEAPTG